MKRRVGLIRVGLVATCLAWSPPPLPRPRRPRPPCPVAGIDRVPGAEDGFVHSGDVNIHFVQLGKKDKPLLVMIHGFPDFWYSWRAQMPALAKQFHVVAIDQRGNNLSDNRRASRITRPRSWSATCWRWSTTSRRQGRDRGARLGRPRGLDVRHDPSRPDRPADRAQSPHPRGLMRELLPIRSSRRTASTPATSEARRGQEDLPRILTFWVRDPEARKVYREALKRSSMEGMLSYYKANYPSSPADARGKHRRPSMRN